MIADLKAALRVVAEALPPGTPVPVPAEQLLELLDGHHDGDRREVPAPADRLLTAREVAPRLGVSTRYLYGHRGDYPFTKRLPSGAVRFSERGLARFLEQP